MASLYCKSSRDLCHAGNILCGRRTLEIRERTNRVAFLVEFVEQYDHTSLSWQTTQSLSETPPASMKSNSQMGLSEGSTLHTYTEINPCSHNWTLEKEWIHSLKLTFSHNKHWNSIRKHWRGNWIDMLDQVYTQHSLFSCSSFLWYGIFLEETVMSHFPIASNTLWICELNVGHMCFDKKLSMCFYCIFIDKLPNHENRC